MSLSLSDDQLRDIQAAQSVLLSPLAHSELSGWQNAVTRSVQDVIEADHVYSFFTGTDQQPSLAVHDVDPEFYDGLLNYFELAMKGELPFDDPMPIELQRSRLAAGPGVHHELDLTTRSRIENAPSYQAFFAPHGIRYTTGMSVPLPSGEAAICFAFESSDAEGYDPAAGDRLRLLMPAFEAGLTQWRQFGASAENLSTLIDTFSDAVVLFDADGRERHRNRSLVELLALEPAADTIMRLARTLATSEDDAISARRTVKLENGTYTLRAGRAPLSVFDEPGTLVTIERDSHYPSPPVLQSRFGLTPREAEVALLLAQGLSNEAIAEQLFISPHTARHHVQRVMKKLGVPSRSGVAHALLQNDS